MAPSIASALLVEMAAMAPSIASALYVEGQGAACAAMNGALVALCLHFLSASELTGSVWSVGPA